MKNETILTKKKVLRDDVKYDELKRISNDSTLSNAKSQQIQVKDHQL